MSTEKKDDKQKIEMTEHNKQIEMGIPESKAKKGTGIPGRETL